MILVKVVNVVVEVDEEVELVRTQVVIIYQLLENYDSIVLVD
jgi:hypothetical protein